MPSAIQSLFPSAVGKLATGGLQGGPAKGAKVPEVRAPVSGFGSGRSGQRERRALENIPIRAERPGRDPGIASPIEVFREIADQLDPADVALIERQIARSRQPAEPRKPVDFDAFMAPERERQERQQRQRFADRSRPPEIGRPLDSAQQAILRWTFEDRSAESAAKKIRFWTEYAKRVGINNPDIWAKDFIELGFQAVEFKSIEVEQLQPSRLQLRRGTGPVEFKRLESDAIPEVDELSAFFANPLNRSYPLESAAGHEVSEGISIPGSPTPELAQPEATTPPGGFRGGRFQSLDRRTYALLAGVNRAVGERMKRTDSGNQFGITIKSVDKHGNEVELSRTESGYGWSNAEWESNEAGYKLGFNVRSMLDSGEHETVLNLMAGLAASDRGIYPLADLAMVLKEAQEAGVLDHQLPKVFAYEAERALGPWTYGTAFEVIRKGQNEGVTWGQYLDAVAHVALGTSAEYIAEHAARTEDLGVAARRIAGEYVDDLEPGVPLPRNNPSDSLIFLRKRGDDPNNIRVFYSSVSGGFREIAGFAEDIEDAPDRALKYRPGMGDTNKSAQLRYKNWEKFRALVSGSKRYEVLVLPGGRARLWQLPDAIDEVAERAVRPASRLTIPIDPARQAELEKFVQQTGVDTEGFFETPWQQQYANQAAAQERREALARKYPSGVTKFPSLARVLTDPHPVPFIGAPEPRGKGFVPDPTIIQNALRRLPPNMLEQVFDPRVRHPAPTYELLRNNLGGQVPDRTLSELAEYITVFKESDLFEADERKLIGSGTDRGVLSERDSGQFAGRVTRQRVNDWRREVLVQNAEEFLKSRQEAPVPPIAEELDRSMRTP